MTEKRVKGVTANKAWREMHRSDSDIGPEEARAGTVKFCVVEESFRVLEVSEYIGYLVVFLFFFDFLVVLFMSLTLFTRV